MNNTSSVKIDSLPEITRQSNEYKPGFISKKLMYSLIKYGTWLVLCLLMFFTGLGRYIGDLAYERGYPYTVFTWGGFALLVYIVFSVITFIVDWKLDNNVAHEYGIHNMPPINILGRWLRKTFIDSFGFFFISLFVLTCYYIPLVYNSNLKLSSESSPSWWIVAGLISLILIPVYFSIRNTLITLLNNSIKRVAITKPSANSTAVSIIFGIINTIIIVVMWIAFSYLRLFQYYSWISFTVLLTLIWVVLFVMMLAGKLKNKETQFSIAYAIFVSVLVSWIFMLQMGYLAETTLFLPIRFAYFIIISVLLTLMIMELVGAFQLTSMQSEKTTTIYDLCKRFSVIPLGIYTYELSGDNSVETKLFGFFGLYYLIIPANLEDKQELYASIATALSKTKGGYGTVLTIVRAILFTLSCIGLWWLFDSTYLSPNMSWFSGITGDPILIFGLLLFFGAVFGVIGTPLVNAISSVLTKSSTKNVSKLIDQNVLDSYNSMEGRALGIEGSTDKIANIYYCRNEQAN